MLKMLNPLMRLCLLLLPIAASLSGCAPQTKTAETKLVSKAENKAACRVWRRLTWSPSDTRESIDGIRRNNVRRKHYCGAR